MATNAIASLDLTALILSPDHPAPHRIGGLRVVDRAVRVLAAAGVPRVLVAGPASAGAAGTEPVAAGTALPAGRYLVVAGDQLFDTDTVRALAAAGSGTVRAEGTGLAVTGAAGATGALAGKGLPAGRVVPPAGYALAVTDPASARRGERELWHRYGPKPTDGLVSRYLNRPLSRPVTLAALRLGLSPDTLTLASFLVTVIGAAAIGFGGHWWTMLAGGLLVQAGNALDGVDGEAARISLRASRRGALLDTTLDRYADLAVIAGLVLAAGDTPRDWAVGFAAAAASLLISYINALVPTAPRRLLRRDVRLLLCALAAATGLPLWGLLIVAVLGNLDAVRVFAAVIHRS